MSLAPACAELVETLGLLRRPVALSFLANPPEGVVTCQSSVPSACTFWTQAEKGLFFAKDDSHQNCPIGAMTMGFTLSEQARSNLQSFVTRMCDVSYLQAKEAQHIPRVEKHSAGILYGPLAHFPIQPDLALVWVNGQQAMVLQEVLGTVCWDGAEKRSLSGRPACAALALAMNEQQPRLSLGCAGMRTFSEVPDEYLLVALPGSELETLPERMRSILSANQQMLAFYRAHKATFSHA